MSTERLAEYGARLIMIDGCTTVEMADPNDNARARYQYRRTPEGLERRILTADGHPFEDSGSPWESLSDGEMATLRTMAGEYHPILDPLGLIDRASLSSAAAVLGRRGGAAGIGAAKRRPRAHYVRASAMRKDRQK